MSQCVVNGVGFPQDGGCQAFKEPLVGNCCQRLCGVHYVHRLVTSPLVFVALLRDITRLRLMEYSIAVAGAEGTFIAGLCMLPRSSDDRLVTERRRNARDVAMAVNA